MGLYFLCFIVIIKYNLSTEENKTIKIGLSLPFEDEYWRTYAEYFNQSAEKFKKEEGINFEIKVRFSKRSVSIQQADLENLIANKIDVLIITAHDTKASKNIIKYCELIDIPIIAFNRLISDVELKAFISPNMTQAGQYQAEFLLQNLKNNTNKTKFLVMRGPDSDINSKLLFDGAMNIFRTHPNTKNNVDKNDIFKIMTVPNWDPIEAEKLCSNLENDFLNNLGYIVAANDDIGKACISALKNVNLSEIYMAGHDYSIDSIKELFKKLQYNFFTVDMNQSNDTYIALNVSKNLVLGKPFEFKETFKNGQYDNPYLCGNVLPINYTTFQKRIKNESFDNKW